MFVLSLKIPVTGSIFIETVKVNPAEPILSADHSSLDFSSPQISSQRPRVHSQNTCSLAECQQLLPDWVRLNFRSPPSHRARSSRVRSAGRDHRTFKNGTAAEVRKAVKEARVCVTGLQAILKPIGTRRNQTVAHLDPKAIVDRDGYIREGQVRYCELDGLFEQTGLILNRLSILYRGKSVRLHLDGEKDYEHALNLIAGQMRAR